MTTPQSAPLPEPTPAVTGPPQTEDPVSSDGPIVQTTESLQLLFRNLRSSATGLTSRDAARRLTLDGPNQLTRHGKPQPPATAGHQRPTSRALPLRHCDAS